MRVLTVRSLARGPVSSRPAMWVDGNVHGNEVQGSDACLYLAWYLLENYGKVDRVTELLDRVSFFILPTVNPDGRAWWFNHPNTPSSSRSGKAPRDNDLDGLVDEDGPNDLDGDGELLQMRIRDPEGRWRVSRDDPRLMERVGPGEKGEWTLLGQEGIDDDGDGRINEDGPGGYDMNRNWPSFWMPDFIQYGAGEYPFSYPEPRAIGDFILARDNIAAVQSFHNSGGMILRGPGIESFGSYPSGDVRIYDQIGADGEAMLPFYRYMVIWRDLYSVYGGFVTWTYEHRGIISFTNELWSVEAWLADQSRWPQRIAQARRNRHVLPARVTIEVEGGSVLGEGKYPRSLPEADQAGVRRLEWVVSAAEGSTVRVRVSTELAGDAMAEKRLGVRREVF